VKALTATDLLTTCGRHENRLKFVTPEIESNAHGFVEKLNKLLLMFGESRELTSGFRDPASNLAAGGSAGSWHMKALAGDIEDDNEKFGKFIVANPKALEECGLYAEHPSATFKVKNGKIVRWVHVQSKPPRSKRRIFFP
jgi:hypothetical protein